MFRTCLSESDGTHAPGYWPDGHVCPHVRKPENVGRMISPRSASSYTREKIGPLCWKKVNIYSHPVIARYSIVRRVKGGAAAGGGITLGSNRVKDPVAE